MFQDNLFVMATHVKTTIMHCHHVDKIVEFDEFAQADELSFCVRLL